MELKIHLRIIMRGSAYFLKLGMCHNTPKVWEPRRRLHELPKSFVGRTIFRIFFPGAARSVDAALVRDRGVRPAISLPPAVPQEHASFHHAEEWVPCHHSQRNKR